MMRSRTVSPLALLALLVASPARAQPIDLLRAARADVAVSSAYRDRLAQAAALVDGDLETAWNSRTGDLAGAWIEARLPADAAVSSIALTVGFTRHQGTTDLFTGNHRVTRVRVLRDGREVGAFDLDPASRALQTLPVSGPGGVYRVEVVAVAPGSNRRWREVCISELRVLGTAPGAAAGRRFPRLAIGALPAPRPSPGAADRAALARQLRDMTGRLGREWGALVGEQRSRATACALDDSEMAATGALRLRRLRFLLQVAEMVELVDEARADALRAAAFSHDPTSSAHYQLLEPGDQDALAAGFAAVVDWLGDEPARCRWSSAEAQLRLRRASDAMAAANHVCEHVDMDYPDGPPGDVVRECRAIERALSTVEDLAAGSLRAQRLRTYRVSETLPQRFRDEWAGLQVALTTASASCGW